MSSARHAAIPLSSSTPGSHPVCDAGGNACQCSHQHGRCLLLVMLTQPYLAMYVNWLRAITKVSPAVDLLVVSEDRESCQWLRASGLQPGTTHVLRHRAWRRRHLHRLEFSAWSAGNTSITVECASNASLPANSSANGSPGFATLMRRRAGHIRRAVRGRCCVVWSDLDALWLRDPMPYLRDAPETCTAIATQQPCTTGGTDGRCLTAAFSAFYHDEDGSVATLMRRWASLMPRATKFQSGGKRREASLDGKMPTLDDAVRGVQGDAKHRGGSRAEATVCKLPAGHFPDSSHTKWEGEALTTSMGRAEAPFVVHADFARIPQKVAHLRSAGLWKRGSRREVTRVQAQTSAFEAAGAFASAA